MNLRYLNNVLKQTGMKLKFKNSREVINELKKKIKNVKTDDIIKDIGRFLEDRAEEAVLKKYPDAFAQAVSRYPSTGSW